MYKSRQRFMQKHGMNGSRFPQQRNFRKARNGPSRGRTDLEGCTQHERLIGEALNKNGIKVFKRGWPDFLCLSGDTIFTIEVKRPGEDVRYDQHRMHKALKKLGVKVFIVHSVKEAEEVMDRMDCRDQTPPVFNQSTEPRLAEMSVS